MISNAEPARAAWTALMIGNSVYESKCAEDLPNVPVDVALMSTALASAGYTIASVGNRSGIQMATDIESNIPPATDKYIIYYQGHAEAPLEGAFVGPDCTRLSPAGMFGALGEDAAHTLLILDSCGSGAFADAMNALDPRICTITASTGTDCVTPGVFTPCFVEGLNGAADANSNGTITVAEAAAYAVANCGNGSTTPTWDGGCPDHPIGVGPVSVDAESWGVTKATYR
jgi:hypothetical protein